MTKSMWTPAHRTSHSKIMGINMELVPLLCCYNSLHSSGKAFHMLEHCCGDMLPFSHKSIREVGHSRRSNSSQSCGIEVKGSRSRLCAGPVKFFHIDLDKPFLYGPRIVHGSTVMLKQEKAFPKLLPQSWKHRIA